MTLRQTSRHFAHCKASNRMRPLRSTCMLRMLRSGHEPEGPRQRNFFDSYVGCDCRGYEAPTMGKMTLPSLSFLARPMRNIATAPSNYKIHSHPHRYRTIDVAVQDPAAGGDRRSIPLDVRLHQVRRW